MSDTTPKPFVHLHNHSEYSLLDGIARIGDIAKRCVELGFPAYALTDHGVMYGALEFYQTMRKHGVKPIIGCEVYVAARGMTDKDPTEDRRSRHLVLLAKDITGYRNLMKLTSLAHIKGYYYKPRIDVELLKAHKEGLVALTACPGGVVAGPYNFEGGGPAADRALEKYLGIFGPDNLFLEIQNHHQPVEHNFIEWATDAAQRHGVRLVATNDCHYVHEEDARAHDIALCLRDKKTLMDEDRMKYSGPDYFIKSYEQMQELFPNHPEALANTMAVSEMCNLDLKLDEVHFPRFTIPLPDIQPLKEWVQEYPEYAEPDAGKREDLVRHIDDAAGQAVTEGEIASTEETSSVFVAYLRKLTYEGAERRYGEVTKELQDRIEYEFSVIIPKGFSTYFLICSDFCKYSRRQGIPVGPGRGSAAGSVVAYCLEVTDLEPIKYDLYFERFLNPERIELPDFDIDFCMRRRDEVIEYVRNKYGANRTAMIVTFSRLKARAVIKAVGRTKGLEFQRTDKVTKEIQGLNPTIDEAIEQSRELKRMINEDREIAELIEDARRLEGIAAHHSVHAAGLVISPEDLWHFVPAQPLKDTDMLVTQYAMDTVPKTGLVKFDFLGLRNLTMIQDTVDFIKEINGTEIDPRAIPDDDGETYSTLQRGDQYGVFQFEAPQVKRMLIEGRPENVIDLAAINAANRPGPLQSGNTEIYLNNRKTRTVDTSRFPSIREIMLPTGGVLLFQEQVLEIAKQLGDFTLGEADVLRKAMGKKKFDIMEEQKKKFMAGALKKNIPESELKAIWEMMEAFAGYGFNKAHSVCYAWIAFQTAYLKTHYRHYYMSAMLNCYMGHSDKLAQILAQCRKMRLTVLPPSVNYGGAHFKPTRDGKIIFGLAGIKGIGAAAVEAIVTERKLGGEFKTLAGFLNRTKGKGVNRKVLQSLAMAGAFDCIEDNRLELIRNLDDIESYMRGPDNQISLFGMADEPEMAAGATPTLEVTQMDVAMLEKQAVGVFLSIHPFEDHIMYRDARHMQLFELEDSVLARAGHWADKPIPNRGLVGLLTDLEVRVANTSKKQYAKARLEDPERSVAMLIWPKTYESAKELIAENQPVVIRGRIQLPDTVESPEDAWDGLEIVVEQLEQYHEDGAVARKAAINGNGQDSEFLDTDDYQSPLGMDIGDTRMDPADDPDPSESPDSFSALEMNTPIWLEVDLSKARYDQLESLAQKLMTTRGDREVCMCLRDVSNQIKRIKLDQRFYTNLEATEQLREEFPFITPQTGLNGGALR